MKKVVPHNKLLFFVSDDVFIYNHTEFNISELKKDYLIDNLTRKELSEKYSIPISTLCRIISHYNCAKPKSLSNKNVVKNIDWTASIQKAKQTKLEKYGDATYSNREKAKQTCVEKYGEDNIFKTKSFKENLVAINLKKYGCEYNSQADEVKEKKKLTCLETLGVSCPFQTSTVKEKIRLTNIERYGVEYPLQNQEILKKQIETNNTKYNRDYGFDYEKSKQYFLEHFGVEYYAQTLEYHQKSRKHYKYNNESFDSFPELCVYIYALDHNEQIRRLPTSFKYFYGGTEHLYIPDFEYKSTLIEIKGDHFFKPDGTMCNPFDHSQDDLYEAKHKCGLQNNVMFWTSKDYMFAVDYFNDSEYKREEYICDEN